MDANHHPVKVRMFVALYQGTGDVDEIAAAANPLRMRQKRRKIYSVPAATPSRDLPATSPPPAVSRARKNVAQFHPSGYESDSVMVSRIRNVL